MRERSPGTEDSVSYVHKYKLPEIELYSIVQVKCDPSFIAIQTVAISFRKFLSGPAWPGSKARQGLPKIALVEWNSGFYQDLPVFLLKRPLAMMLL